MLKELRRKHLTRRTITRVKSYSDLYRDIVLLVREDWLWPVEIFIFIYFAWYEFYYLVFLPEAFTFPRILGVVGSLFVLVLVMLFTYLAFSASRNPSQAVTGIIVDMVLFYPKPYQNDQGLGYDDIQQLKRIAEVEQNSADWRSSYVNFSIVMIVAAFIANPQLIWNFVIFPLYETLYPIDNLPPDLTNLLPQQSFTERLLGATLALLLILWVLYKWLTYFREFISSEYANRAILLACEELLSIYRIKGLSQCGSIAFCKRRDILELYGYRLVSDENASISDQNWTLLNLGKYGFWYAVPPGKFWNKTQLLTSFTGIKEKILGRFKRK